MAATGGEAGAAVPGRMSFVAHGEGGGPEVLKIATGELPKSVPDEVLIRVLAVVVNRPDVAQRKGEYPPPPGASPILGLEVAGEVVMEVAARQMTCAESC